MENKPTFASLTPVEVNDLIATKFEGLIIEEHAFDGNLYRYKEVWIADGVRQECSWRGDYFNSLDSCWRAEEKMLQVPTNLFGQYLEALSEVVIRALGGMDYLELLKRQKEVGIKTFHATAPQKCEAMLRAIGEVN